MRVHAIHVDDVPWTHITIAFFFPVVTISVGLAQARPNNNNNNNKRTIIARVSISFARARHF